MIRLSLGKIDDISAVDLYDLLDRRTFCLVSVDLQQQQLSVDAVCGIQREDLADYFQLGCLRNDLVECLFRSR